MIRKRHLSADDALHAFTAKVGKCDLLVMADDYFAARMKDSADKEEDPTETDQLSYEVFNIRLKEDYGLLEEKMSVL